MASLTLQRSMAELRKRGYTVGKTEMPWNRFSKVRQDFCGFADAIAFSADSNEVLAIQACAANGDPAKHLRKLAGLESAKVWVSQPARRLEIWSWGKKGQRGKRKLWTLKVIPFELEKAEAETTFPVRAPILRNEIALPPIE